MTPRRLGVLGTMVWDRIHAREGAALPIEEWGGLAYALAAAAAAIPAGWQVVPIVKVGRDLEESAYRFFRSLPNLDLEAGVRTVGEPNNRVELRYVDRERRTERLTGGVLPWTWPELEPCVRDLDALYVNFIAGFELTLESAVRLRLGFRGPMYADLHSLLLDMDVQGNRVPRPLAAWSEWLRCFDAVQVNEDELALLSHHWGDPWRFAAEVVGDELKLLLVTLGERGAAYVASPAFRPDPLTWRPGGLVVAPPPLRQPGAALSQHIAVAGAGDGDPTGCGDVWGATAFCSLLGGAGLDAAMEAANRAAARNYAHRGASGLYHHLRGRIGS
jgi:sugar/nucleoside kinase (ribokinase family)